MEANLSFGVSGEWEAFTPPALAFALFANRGRANALTYGGGLSATGCAGLRCARQPAGRSGVALHRKERATRAEEEADGVTAQRLGGGLAQRVPFGASCAFGSASERLARPEPRERQALDFLRRKINTTATSAVIAPSIHKIGLNT